MDDEESMELEDPRTDAEEEEESEDELEEDQRPIVHSKLAKMFKKLS